MNELEGLNWKQLLLRLAGMTGGCVIYAMGVGLFLDPLTIAPGGLSGISIVLATLLPLETGTILLILNIPLLILGLRVFGRGFLLNTVYATVASSLMINGVTELSQGYPLVTENPLLAAIAGCACVGCGMGIVYRCGGTTGGTDIIVKVLRTKFPHIKTGSITMALDVAVICLVTVVTRDLEIALIAAIGVVISGSVMNRVLYQADEAILLMVVSRNSRQIARRILSEADLGVTLLPATGAYTGNSREVLMCVAHKRVYARVRRIIREEDDAAFTIITSASAVYGEGFKDPFAQEL
ncbi:MAG: YitT family protein [Clostridiales bacterium]|nr:YitT family protein [Clostridiales bacterium]